MNKLLKIANKAWKFLNGKKRNIGILTMIAGTGLGVFNVLTQDQANFISNLGLGIAGYGWMHSVSKDKKVTDSINKAKNAFKKQ